MNCGKLAHSFLYISACTQKVELVEDRVASLLSQQRPPRILKLHKEGSDWVFVYILIVALAEVKPPDLRE